MATMAAILDFRSIFELQVTTTLPTKLKAFNAPPPHPPPPLVSGEEAKIDFKMAALLFLIYKLPWCFLTSFESAGLSVPEKNLKIDFQDGLYGVATMAAILDFQSERF